MFMICMFCVKPVLPMCCSTTASSPTTHRLTNESTVSNQLFRRLMLGAYCMTQHGSLSTQQSVSFKTLVKKEPLLNNNKIINIETNGETMGDFNEYIEDPALTVQGRQGNVTFKPYRDIKSKQVKNILVSDTQEHNVTESIDRIITTVENLYPELLCLIFSVLDTESKGRTAQV
jgi:hypothetical protein